MNQRALRVVEDGVILVLAARQRCGRIHVFAMKVLAAQIPATRPLQQIPPDGGSVPNLRRGRMGGRFGERRIAAAHLRR